MSPPESTTRERILAAAIEAFVAHGYAGARIDGIAKGAGCNKQLIYHHFGDKEALYTAVIEHALAQKPLPDSNGPFAAVDHVVEMFERGHEERCWMRLNLWEALQGQEVPSAASEPRRRRLAEVVSKLREAQGAGLIPANHLPEHMLVAVMSLALGPYVLRNLVQFATGAPPEDDTFREGYARILRELLPMLLDPPKSG